MMDYPHAKAAANWLFLIANFNTGLQRHGRVMRREMLTIDISLSTKKIPV